MAKKKSSRPRKERAAKGSETAATKRPRNAEPDSATEKVPAPQRSDDATPVVGIGCSAGGLDAALRFFAAMPPDAGMAFVVVQHLDPKRNSMTSELLGKKTAMPVSEVAENTAVQPNRVYVMPPNHCLSIAGGVLKLSKPEHARGAHAEIDYFLRTLADDQHERAIAIILSGTGADGSIGARAIKAAGGMTIAQDPETAQHEGMPQSAIATGMVDHVLSVEQMPAVLLRYAQHPYVNGGEPPVEVATKKSFDVNSILALIRARTKYDFRTYKKKTLIRRMGRRMGLHHIESLPHYLEFVRERPDEVNALVKDLLISVTDFFRDPEAWSELEDSVIAPLVRDKSSDVPIRVWIPGCATGEEPYSVAMLLNEHLQRAQKHCPIQVFATDVDREALDRARHGRYPPCIGNDLAPDRLRRFFVEHKEDQYYEVTKQLRDSVVFAEQNLISDPPFSRLDLICCRNLLIYLEPDVQEKIISLFHFSLLEGGYLFLGNAETIGRQQDLFRTISPKWRIFRRIGPTRQERIEFPMVAGASPRSIEVETSPRQRREMRMAQLAQQQLLGRFAPASVLVDRNHEILFFCGATDDFLTQPTGIPTSSLLDRAREGLRSKLRAAVQRALSENQVIHVDTRLKRRNQMQTVRVTIIPVNDHQEKERLALVVFEEVSDERPDPPGDGDGEAKPAEATDGDADVAHLERELATTRDDLQATIEQMETSNEELKAANEEVMSINEELQSTNEELETSKEELQSLNEELTTVNAQLAVKVAELEAKNDDLNNLLSSTDLATICLDSSFRIRWFTPAVRSLVSLVPTDVGRPLRDFSHRFTSEDILEDAEAVLRTLMPVEREVGADDKRWLLRRVLPYRTADNHIDGVVITFTNVTSRKKVEEGLRQLNETLEQHASNRTRLLRLVHDIASASNEAETVVGALQFALERICKYNDWPVGHIYQIASDLTGEATPTSIWYCHPRSDFRRLMEVTEKTRIGSSKDFIQHVLITGQPVAIENLEDDPHWTRGAAGDLGVHSSMAFPIYVGRRTVAVLEFYSTEKMAPDEKFMDAMQNIGIQLGQVIQRKDSERQVAEATSREQRRIGQELHDGLSQQISAIAMLASTVADHLKADKSRQADAMARLVDAVEKAKQQARAINKGLMPVEVEGPGLMAALAELAFSVQQLHKIQCTFDCPEEVLIRDAYTATHLYHIAQEAVHNAVKHANPTRVVISLTDGKQIALSVSDDGAGLRERPEEIAGQGFRIMRYRAGVIGASLTIHSGAKGGVVVSCTLPKK